MCIRDSTNSTHMQKLATDGGDGMGIGYKSGDTNWTGSIGNVRVWAEARTQQQLQENMDNASPDFTSGLWKMDALTIGQIQINGDASIMESSTGGTAQTATITITGTNDAPVINGDVTASITEDDTQSVSGALSITDGDAGEAEFHAETIVGVYGSLTIDPTGAWSYADDNTLTAVQALDAAITETDTLVVRSADNTTETITITITGTDDVPVVTGAVTGTADDTDGVFTVDLLSGASDLDAGDTLTISALSLTSGSDAGVTISGTSLTVDPTAYASLPAGTTEVIAYSYDITDTSGNTVAQTASVTITGRNEVPTSAGDVVGGVCEAG